MHPVKEAIFRLAGIFATILSCFSLSGCIVTSGAAFGAASGAMEAKGVGNDFKYYVFDVPPQVIYRIDDHRFFTLENYKDCDHGGIVYYHDTNKNIKEYINGGSDSNSILTANPMMSWKGQFIYAASDKVLAFMSRYPLMSDRDTHSGVFVTYRINNKYGQVFVTSDTDPGYDMIVLITDENTYIKSKGIRGDVYDLKSTSFNTYNGSISDHNIVENKDWPQVSTPSGAIRFTCDMSIRPTNVSVTPEQVYATDATGIPRHE
ncbi:hypothetical protein LMA04_03320 [Pseudescherichia vulneris]|uniref:T6SS immunity protein Tli3 family protein n=1 Tax=Pseudescherichia vulneris TaxID=566 RepID=UPI00227BF1EF|nr:hypothetical protein [Pseudescherichia vulneris]WAH53095.1 hypothetical protein LMA04_03320 [Pseudescherichia vulneris]